MRSPQLRLFTAREFVHDSDLGRLTRVIEILPDNKLIHALQKKRASGRPYRHDPRVLWHIMLAGIILRHKFITEVLDELRRNCDLREAVGLFCVSEIPKPYEMSRFINRLVLHTDLIEEMFRELVHRLNKFLPDLGKHLACDATHIYTCARGRAKPQESADPQAHWGIKTKIVDRPDGTSYEQTFRWFGYKLHLLVDSFYELPIAFKVTPANVQEGTQLLSLVEQAADNLQNKPTSKRRATKENRCAFEEAPLAADKAYDHTENYRALHENYRIKAVIDMVHQKNRETGLNVYDVDRFTRFYHPDTKQWHEFIFCGYEKRQHSLKYRCPCDPKQPCSFYGQKCNKHKDGLGFTFRVKLSENYRYYTAIPRESKKWKREYNRRTAVERVFSRLKQVLEIEHSGFRTQQKVTIRVMGGLLVMLAHAVSCLEQNQIDKIRSMCIQTPAARAA